MLPLLGSIAGAPKSFEEPSFYLASVLRRLSKRVGGIDRAIDRAKLSLFCYFWRIAISLRAGL